MFEDEIKEIDKWFQEKEKEQGYYQRTYHHTIEDDGEDLYKVDSRDVQEFTDYLNELDSDLIGFSCMVGNDGIWFTSEELFDARYV